MPTTASQQTGRQALESIDESETLHLQITVYVQYSTVPGLQNTVKIAVTVRATDVIFDSVQYQDPYGAHAPVQYTNPIRLYYSTIHRLFL